MQNGSGNGHDPPRLLGWGPIADWEADAACQDAPLEWFFGREHEDIHRSIHGPIRTKAQQAKAEALCNGCPVLANCRSWAIDSGIPYGYLAGMTESQRRQERQRRGLSPNHYTSGTRPDAFKPSPASIKQGSIKTDLGTISIRVERWSNLQGQNDW
jgi:WhiB family redox-sensing transcriptional regulator